MTSNRRAGSGPRDSFSPRLGPLLALLFLAASTLVMVGCSGNDPTTPSANQATEPTSIILGAWRVSAARTAADSHPHYPLLDFRSRIEILST